MHVLVFGAGIAGLSAAHFLVQRGYQVTVVESLPVPGGLARSERRQDSTPSEYSWRGFGPWYHNTFDLMRSIPSAPLPHETRAESAQSVYERELSRPIHFLLVPDAPTRFADMSNFTDSLRMSWWDKAKMVWLALHEWTASDERSEAEYAPQLMRDWLNRNISTLGAKTLNSVSGPWIGVDASRASVHHASRFFRKNTFPGPPAPHAHEAVDANPASGQAARPGFAHGNAARWLVLRRPTSEAWFEPWVKHLRDQGVRFLFDTKLERLLYTPHRIEGAVVSRQGKEQTLVADYYVLAMDPFHTRDIVAQSPGLEAADASLQMFRPLVAGGPHTQVAFQIAFDEPVRLPGVETAVILVDSEYNLTFFSQDQLFHPQVHLGPGVRSLWSGTATIDATPGPLYGLPFTRLTKEQFEHEVLYQLYRSRALDDMVRQENGGRALASFPVRFSVWHSWAFPDKPGGVVTNEYPKWVNDTRNLRYQPGQRTSLPNLFLAGAHTKTETDLYSMEAAAESGRKVADAISKQNTVIHQQLPLGVGPLKAVDAHLFRMGAPHVLNVLLVLLLVVGAIVFGLSVR